MSGLTEVAYGRVVAVGESQYMSLPIFIRQKLGIARGDRLVYLQRADSDDLIVRKISKPKTAEKE